MVASWGNTDVSSSDEANEVANIWLMAMIDEQSEPKFVNAFQRVKTEEVKFADEKLEDNTYWAKDGAHADYGAKAQEVFGQVKGRGFSHDKTKKKSGSYRGEQLDLHYHAVNFNYDNENRGAC